MAKPNFLAVESKTLIELLEAKAPLLSVAKDPLRQLRYISDYIRTLKCTALIVEEEYIDRDYIEDYSAFYARSFVGCGHLCQRIHFFADIDKETLRVELNKLADLPGEDPGLAKIPYRRACIAFSDKHYLGFMIRRPLAGCPVGRTVLKPFPKHKEEEGAVREFDSCRYYKIHLLGVELRVRGLAFQQQDQGVSACATTAVWSSLQSLKSLEDVAVATPAKVTSAASEFALPFGRAMPSEGLDVNQMCQAIHAFGVSPDLLRADSYAVARAQIYSAALSGLAPILILQKPGSRYHAVTVSGIKRPEKRRSVGRGFSGMFRDGSGNLSALYLHDDRWGPYACAELSPVKDPELRKKLQVTQTHAQVTLRLAVEEAWLLTHILTPVHPKVRLSFSSIQKIGWEIAKQVFVATPKNNQAMEYDIRILRGHTYVEKLLSGKFPAQRRDKFFEQVTLSRYVGLFQMRRGEIGPFDALIDTTGTRVNVTCLGIVNRGSDTEENLRVGEAVAERFGCSYITG